MKNPDLFVVFNQTGNVASATVESPDWHVSPTQRVVEYEPKEKRDTEPAPAYIDRCDYDDCDQDADVTFKDGTGMCRFHAIDSLLSQATLDEVRMIRNIFEKQWRDA